MKPIVLTARVAVAGLAAVTVGACSSTGRSTAPGSPPVTTGADLHGYPVGSFACPPPGDTSGGSSVPSTPVPASSVTGLLVCRPRTTGSGPGVAVEPSQPQFRVLLAALAAPDLPHQSGPCPLYADVVQPVLARTSTEVLRVHVPVDGCGHYQAAARAALRSVPSR